MFAKSIADFLNFAIFSPITYCQFFRSHCQIYVVEIKTISTLKLLVFEFFRIIAFKKQ